jgi:hypothetical protein
LAIVTENERLTRSCRYLLTALPVAVLAAVLVSALTMPILLRNACSYGDKKPVQFCDLEMSEAAWLGINRAGLPAGVFCAAGLFLMGLVINFLRSQSANTPWWLLLNALLAATASFLLCQVFVMVGGMIS